MPDLDKVAWQARVRADECIAEAQRQGAARCVGRWARNRDDAQYLMDCLGLLAPDDGRGPSAGGA